MCWVGDHFRRPATMTWAVTHLASDPQHLSTTTCIKPLLSPLYHVEAKVVSNRNSEMTCTNVHRYMYIYRLHKFSECYVFVPLFSTLLVEPTLNHRNPQWEQIHWL